MNALELHLAEPCPECAAAVAAPTERRAPRRHTSRAHRLQEIVGALARHGLEVPLARMRIAHCPRWRCRARCTWQRWTGRMPSDLEWPVALRDAMIELGPTFVKLGQVLSVRSDLVPPHVVAALQPLQSDVPPVPFELLRAEVERCLGEPLSSAFRRFDEAPLAAGSIAQVHVAELPDGRRVAVKIKRPGIDEVVRQDLEILVWLAHRLEATFPAARASGAVAVAEELRRYTLLELDFRNEGRVTREVRRGLSTLAGVRVPEVHHIGSDLLVLEFIDSFPLDDVAAMDRHDLERHALVRLGMEAVLTQLFDLGTFHADPHPGNLHVTPDGELVLLDFGIYGRLDEHLQRYGSLLIWALARGDAELASFFLLRLGQLAPDADVPAFRRAVEERYRAWHGKSLAEYGFARLVYEELSLGMHHGVRFPPDLVLFGKSLLTMEGVVLSVEPDFDLSREARPYLEHVRDRLFSPARIGEGLLRSAPLWWDVAERLPLGLAEMVEQRMSPEPTAPAPSGPHPLAAPLLAAASLLGGALLVAVAASPTLAGVSVIGALLMLLAAAWAWRQRAPRG